MKPCALLAVAAWLLLAATASQPELKDDLTKLQGEWVLVSGERDGKQLPEEEAKKIRMRVIDNQLGISGGVTVGTSLVGTLALDPTEKPKWIDAVATTGSDQGKPWLGIYDLEGQLPMLCFAPPGKDRPKEFATKSGSGHILLVWKRSTEKQ